MIDQPPAYSADLIDWGFPLLTSIELSPDQMDRAVQLSQTVPNATQQWQTYLNALALFGFREWLDERAPDLEVIDTHCSLFQPAYANLIEAVCNLQVGSFLLCLITTGTLIDAIATLPRAVIDQPPFVPHIYTLVRVLEEQMQVQVYGYLRHDQLVEHQQSSPLQVTPNLTYALPLDWFNLDPTELLLDLRCLQPESISQRTTTLQRLTPAPQPQNSPSLPTPHSPLPTLNVSLWLRDRLDTLAQELSWVLMPAFASDSALRSALRSVEEELENRGVRVPPEARGAYQDLYLESVVLRLYAITWILPLTPDTQGWTLLVVLGAQSGTRLPVGTRLQVQDETQLLVEQVLEEDSPDSYLYAQVGGTWDERFWVTIDATTGTAVTLPPFTFRNDE